VNAKRIVEKALKSSELLTYSNHNIGKNQNIDYVFNNVSGVIRMYISKHPCLSCIVNVFFEIRRKYPNVILEVDYKI